MRGLRQGASDEMPGQPVAEPAVGLAAERQAEARAQIEMRDWQIGREKIVAVDGHEDRGSFQGQPRIGGVHDMPDIHAAVLQNAAVQAAAQAQQGLDAQAGVRHFSRCVRSGEDRHLMAAPRHLLRVFEGVGLDAAHFRWKLR